MLAASGSPSRSHQARACRRLSRSASKRPRAIAPRPCAAISLSWSSANWAQFRAWHRKTDSVSAASASLSAGEQAQAPEHGLLAVVEEPVAPFASAARRVCCRVGAAMRLRLAVSTRSRWSIDAARRAPRAGARAAASSMASAKPSSARQTSMTAGALSSLRRQRLSACIARASNSATAERARPGPPATGPAARPARRAGARIPRQPQRRLAGDEQPQAGRGVQQRPGQGRHGVQQVLGVVQHHRQRQRAQCRRTVPAAARRRPTPAPTRRPRPPAAVPCRVEPVGRIQDA
jgi:hypothetical protein